MISLVDENGRIELINQEGERTLELDTVRNVRATWMSLQSVIQIRSTVQQ